MNPAGRQTDERHTARYHQTASGDAADPRLTSPVYDRNIEPMIAALDAIFGGMSGPVLEIGAGAGQHAAAFARAFPALTWWASDPVAAHRASIAAWAQETGAPVPGPLDIDACANWAEDPAVREIGPLTGILAMNVIHIAPIEAAIGLFRGAAASLVSGGRLVLYGPFTEAGRHTGEGNERFDQGLRADNPKWGVRDADDLTVRAATLGLVRDTFRVMPANNRLLVFRR
ncbi:MAG: DUF938 domain-containing protein [Pseudomonadota bacterium]